LADAELDLDRSVTGVSDKPWGMIESQVDKGSENQSEGCARVGKTHFLQKWGQRTHRKAEKNIEESTRSPKRSN